MLPWHMPPSHYLGFFGGELLVTCGLCLTGAGAALKKIVQMPIPMTKSIKAIQPSALVSCSAFLHSDLADTANSLTYRAASHQSR